MMLSDLNHARPIQRLQAGCRRASNPQSPSANRLPDFLKVCNAKHLDAPIQGLRLSAATVWRCRVPRPLMPATVVGWGAA